MRRHVFLVAAITLAIIGTASTGAAQSNEDPNINGTTGLFVVPRAATYEPGRFAVGTSYALFAREEGDTLIRSVGLMGGYGLTENVEVFFRWDPRVWIKRGFTSERAIMQMARVTVLPGAYLNDHPFAWTQDHDGVGDLIVGAKFRLVGDPYSYDGISFAPFVKVPTGDEGGKLVSQGSGFGFEVDGIGTGRLDFGADLIASAEAFEKIGYNVYAGYTFKGDPDQQAALGVVLVPEQIFEVSDEFRYGAGLQYPTRSPLQLILEGYGIVTTEDATGSWFGMDDITIVQAGLRFTGETGLALSAAVNRNMTVKMRDRAWQHDPEAIDDEIERLGFVFLGSYSSSRRQSVMYRGSEPMALPPVNRPPTLECRAERDTVRLGESVRLFATTSDPDNDRVTVTWAASAGTVTPSTGTEVTWSTEGVEPGTGPISARATDGYGGTADCSLRLTVEAPPPPPEPTITGFGCGEFGSGSARVDNRCKAILDDVALQLRQNPGATAVVTGFSDNTGSLTRNQELALERADNVKAYLVDVHEIDPSRVTVISGGVENPVGDNATREGRAANRRVEIVVTIPPR